LTRSQYRTPSLKYKDNNKLKMSTINKKLNKSDMKKEIKYNLIRKNSDNEILESIVNSIQDSRKK